MLVSPLSLYDSHNPKPFSLPADTQYSGLFSSALQPRPNRQFLTLSRVLYFVSLIMDFLFPKFAKSINNRSMQTCRHADMHDTSNLQ